MNELRQRLLNRLKVVDGLCRVMKKDLTTASALTFRDAMKITTTALLHLLMLLVVGVLISPPTLATETSISSVSQAEALTLVDRNGDDPLKWKTQKVANFVALSRNEFNPTQLKLEQKQTPRLEAHFREVFPKGNSGKIISLKLLARSMLTTESSIFYALQWRVYLNSPRDYQDHAHIIVFDKQGEVLKNEELGFGSKLYSFGRDEQLLEESNLYSNDIDLKVKDESTGFVGAVCRKRSTFQPQKFLKFHDLQKPSAWDCGVITRFRNGTKEAIIIKVFDRSSPSGLNYFMFSIDGQLRARVADSINSDEIQIKIRNNQLIVENIGDFDNADQSRLYGSGFFVYFATANAFLSLQFSNEWSASFNNIQCRFGAEITQSLKSNTLYNDCWPSSLTYIYKITLIENGFWKSTIFPQNVLKNIIYDNFALLKRDIKKNCNEVIVLKEGASAQYSEKRMHSTQCVISALSLVGLGLIDSSLISEIKKRLLESKFDDAQISLLFEMIRKISAY